jgi:hypothetical protein
LLALGAAGAASAQPCCAGPALLTPGRLTAHEDVLLGVQFKLGSIVGSFDGSGAFVAPSPGASEYDLEQDVFATMRILSKGQLSLLIPFIENRRSVPGLSEFGGGVGDLTISGRYDFLLAGESRIPGIAVLLGANLPYGRPPDSAKLTLGSDATGIGSFQGTVGLAIEQAGESLFANVMMLLTQSAARTVGENSGTLGLQFRASAAAGRFWDNGLAVAATLSVSASADAVLNGETEARSGRAETIVGIAAAWQVDGAWRFQASLTDALPVKGSGENQPVGWGLTLLVTRSWI